MSWRRSGGRLLLAAAVVVVALLARPDAPAAKANIGCELGGAAVGTVTGAIGIGNPVGDACNAVTNGAVGAITKPIDGAIEGLGNSIFGQVTDWVAGGASWLIGQVVGLSDETTTPDLTTQGFVAQYRKMAAIAVFLALAMLLFAVLESVSRGSGLLRVVVINLPLALVASSVAFLVVQMLLAATDGVSHAVAVSTEENSKHFFHSAIEGLGSAGEEAGKASAVGPGEALSGAAGKTVAPLFVTFLAALIGAFAAFFVWVELLMRDAAVYVVALFAPMALAASIWPRWSGALRRTVELLLVVIASKFVIVAIIGLAAGLAANSGGRVEHVLAAAALMLLACFAPFVLFKLVPFAEGAAAAAYGRHSAAGGAVSAGQMASSAAMLRNSARANWGQGSHPGASGGGAQSVRFGTKPGPEGSSGARSSGSPEAGVAGATAAEAARAPRAVARQGRQDVDDLAGAEGDQGGGASANPSGGADVGSHQAGRELSADRPDGAESGTDVSAGSSPSDGGAPPAPGSEKAPRHAAPEGTGSEPGRRDDVGGRSTPPGSGAPRAKPDAGDADDEDGAKS
ncbi:MAG TPA: hypothetical protein VH299_14580 [Solirubrobacterales bacterium]|jgi:hypothetical protein|nr:hypothetical protein [Solirubrobacterales bacterium]